MSDEPDLPPDPDDDDDDETEEDEEPVLEAETTSDDEVSAPPQEFPTLGEVHRDPEEEGTPVIPSNQPVEAENFRSP